MGNGTMIFTTGHLLALPTLLLLKIIGSEIFRFLIPVYATIMVLTHLVPFRILLPIGTMNIDDGRAFTRGINGYKSTNITGGYQITLLGFTGITIDVPSIEELNLGRFIFISGFGLSVKSKTD